MNRPKAGRALTAIALAPLATALLAFPWQSASAAESTIGFPLSPKCAHGDAPVGVNMVSKRYLTRHQMRIKTTGMSDAQILTMMMKNHVKTMCLSKAKAMGATMRKPNGERS